MSREPVQPPPGAALPPLRVTGSAGSVAQAAARKASKDLREGAGVVASSPASRGGLWGDEVSPAPQAPEVRTGAPAPSQPVAETREEVPKARGPKTLAELAQVVAAQEADSEDVTEGDLAPFTAHTTPGKKLSGASLAAAVLGGRRG